MPDSLPPRYFDDVYAARADPWDFETSPYETAKYDDTIAALPGRRFRDGFEIGCSIGVLTLRLAARVERLLAVDVSEAALAAARVREARVRAEPREGRVSEAPGLDAPAHADHARGDRHVHRRDDDAPPLGRIDFRRMQVPDEYPPGPLDLVVMSEVAYYWTAPDLERALDRTIAALEPGGTLLMVHWTPEVHDYPQTGDAVHTAALARAGTGGPLVHRAGWRRERYRLDRFERASSVG